MKRIADHLIKQGIKDTTVFLTSTPNNQKGFFYELYNKNLKINSKEADEESFHLSSYHLGDI